MVYQTSEYHDPAKLTHKINHHSVSRGSDFISALLFFESGSHKALIASYPPIILRRLKAGVQHIFFSLWAQSYLL